MVSGGSKGMVHRLSDLFPRGTPKGFFLRGAALWTLAIAVFLGLGLRYATLEEREISLNRARDSFRKDVAYRTWATERGGVYVPLDGKTPANPYLAGLPDREVTTTGGKVLTLVNPAYMTRMVHELAAKEYGLMGHLTSLRPIRPENAPDPWERKALERFERGEREYWEILQEEGRPVLSFMGAFLVQEGCLRCHGAQGYRVGDVRGGIRVSVPLGTSGPLTLSHAHRDLTALALGTIWLLGLGALALWARQEKRLRLERGQALDELQESQHLYQSLAEDLPLSLFRRDRNRRLTYANPALVRELGRSADELMGLTTEEMYAPATAAKLVAEDARVLGGESVHQVHEVQVPGQAEPRRREVVKTPIRNASGEIVGLQGVSWDVTERRRAQEALAASADYYRSIFEDSALGLWEEDFSSVKGRFDQLGASGVQDFRAHFDAHPEDVVACAGLVRITAVNAESVRFFGAASKEELIRQLPEYFTDESWPVFKEELIALANGETRFESGITSRGLKESAKSLVLKLTVLPDAAGDLSRVLVSFLDLTVQMKAEDDRRRLESEIEHMQRLESLGRLAGGVAHDMNNVLSAIMALGSMLEMNHGEDPRLAKAAENILHAAERGRDLVKGLTTFARKEMSEAKPLDLNELVRKEAGLLQRTTLQRVQVQLDLCETEPWVRGEASSLATALMNLCVNALDAMPQGGILRITTRLLAGNLVALSVSDTGEGMPPGVLARAMEPFFTTKPAGKGTGLGLSMVYGTMKAHGGRVDVTSVRGEGTRVTLTFPALSGPGLLPESSAQPGAKTPNHRRLLVVDDDELIRTSMPPMLEGMGHRVQAASGGLEALRRLEAGLQVDLVILDLNMPGMNGIETHGLIRRRWRTLPILLATGHLDTRTSELLEADGHILSIAKPYSMDELVGKLNDLRAMT
jgi:two-component system, cell cycle sensor histidine kinase and response regulator CckA